MTGYIDDITSCAAILLLFGAVLTAALRRRFPTANRLLSFAALGTVAVMTLLLIIFVIAVAASASPRFARFDVLQQPRLATWYCLASVIFAFLPVQLLWFQRIRIRASVVAALSVLLFVPSLLSIITFRSSAEPFYFPYR